MHDTHTNDQRWKELYRVAGVSALVTVAAIFFGLVTYFIYPYAPGRLTAEEILLLLFRDPLGGLISLDLFLLIANVFGMVVFLALYVSLKPISESYALIALALGLVAVVLIIPSRPILELYNLSKHVWDSEPGSRAKLVAAATALLALFDGTSWFANTLLGGISLLISSLLMLRSNVYSRTTAWIGIVTNLLACGFFIPVVGIYLLFLTLPGYIAWYTLLARRYFLLARII